MLRARLGLLALLVSVLALGVSGGTAIARGGVTVELGQRATLIEGGQAVVVEVEASCSPGSQVLEAFVYVVQDGYQSQFAGIPLRCTDQSRTYLVAVRAFPDQPFHAGEAYASTYVLVQDRATGWTESGGANRTIEIR